MTVSITYLSDRIGREFPAPHYATGGSAGCDLCACMDAPVTLAPGQLCRIPTGIAIALPDASVGAFLFARSGLGVRHGIQLSNGVGVIDSDYRGEIQVGLCNVSSEPYTIFPGDRIAQMVFLPVLRPEFQLTDHLEETERGGGGFGSTGR